MENKMNETKPEYPARTVMKIIAESQENRISEELLRSSIEQVFHRLLLAPADWRHRRSNGNRYISYTTTVYIQSSEQLASLYEGLLLIPKVRQVL